MSELTIKPVFFRPCDAKAVLGISRATLYRWMAEGHFKPHKPGRMTLIRVSDVETYIESRGD